MAHFSLMWQDSPDKAHSHSKGRKTTTNKQPCNERNVAQCRAMCRNIAQCGALWNNVTKCGALWHNVARCGAVWRNVAQCGIMWHNMRNVELCGTMLRTEHSQFLPFFRSIAHPPPLLSKLFYLELRGDGVAEWSKAPVR